jgi:hypothetical protein
MCSTRLGAAVWSLDEYTASTPGIRISASVSDPSTEHAAMVAGAEQRGLLFGELLHHSPLIITKS